jgi:hypothetical protein
MTEGKKGPNPVQSSFLKGLNPMNKVGTLVTLHLLKAPLLNPIAWKIKFQHEFCRNI